MAVAEVMEDDAEDRNNTDTNGDGKSAVETPDGRRWKKMDAHPVTETFSASY